MEILSTIIIVQVNNRPRGLAGWPGGIQTCFEPVSPGFDSSPSYAVSLVFCRVIHQCVVLSLGWMLDGHLPAFVWGTSKTMVFLVKSR